MSHLDYISINKATWNNKVETHYQSEFYNNSAFIAGDSSLKSIELELLGDVKGKSIVHLQCHFGQDTISLSKMGAIVTGVDFSESAIEKAIELAKICSTDTKFVLSDVYESVNHIEEKFDLVFTSYGTIGWLPDIDKWASVVSHFLKPGGKFVFVEFHPVVWMFDNDFTNVQYNYFKSEPIVEVETGTYANRNENVQHTTMTWNYSLSEVIQALINNGIQIKSFREYDYSPYSCFNHLYEFEIGKFRISKFDDKIPMVYSIVGQKI